MVFSVWLKRSSVLNKSKPLRGSAGDHLPVLKRQVKGGKRMKDKRKIYYVAIYGRVNTIYGFIRDRKIHHEIVVTTSQQKAKETAWNNLICDMDEPKREYLTRRDFKVECEDWTDIADLINDEDYYYTNPIIEKVVE